MTPEDSSPIKPAPAADSTVTSEPQSSVAVQQENEKTNTELLHGTSGPTHSEPAPLNKTADDQRKAAAEDPDDIESDCHPPQHAVRRKLQAKQTRLMLILLGTLFLMLAAFAWYLFERPVPFESDASEITVQVEEGDSARRVMAKLQENGIAVNPMTMRLAARLSRADLTKIHAGFYRFKAGLSPVDILETIANGALVDQQLRIPEGAPIWEVMRLIREHPAIKQTTAGQSEAQIAALLGLETDSLEGWLAPDTYHFTSGTSDLNLMKVALKQQQDRLQSAWLRRSSAVQTQTLYEALILASIIEKETGKSTDRAQISSVFHNRLRIRMPLQTDPTVIYGIGESFTGNLTRRQLQTPTPYNTYKIQGLPPTPIATPSPASLEAAMHPAETKYLYFVSRGDGSSEFTTNLKDHNRAVRKYILKR